MGYGDITVITILARAILVLSIIIGITTTSILLIFFMKLMYQILARKNHILIKIKSFSSKYPGEETKTDKSHGAKNGLKLR